MPWVHSFGLLSPSSPSDIRNCNEVCTHAIAGSLVAAPCLHFELGTCPPATLQELLGTRSPCFSTQVWIQAASRSVQVALLATLHSGMI